MQYSSEIHGGITKEHLKIFQDYAKEKERIILLRPTNKESLKYVGKSGFIPKPIDVKPKTADGGLLKCGQVIGRQAGLVVDPTLFENEISIFKGAKKQKALKAWSSFIEGKIADHEIKVFLRPSGGFFAVNTNIESEFFGCLMVSPLPLSIKALQKYLSVSKTPDLQQIRYKQLQLKYIHGDYDIFGVVNYKEVIDRLKESTRLPKKEVMFIKKYEERPLFGFNDSTSDDFEFFKKTLNKKMNLEMIQHGPHESFELDTADEDLIVIAPNYVSFIPKNFLQKSKNKDMKDFYSDYYLMEVVKNSAT